MGIISPSPSMKAPDAGTSASQNTSVGSGSRPTASKYKTDTSAPENPRTLGRATSDYLK